MIGKKYHNGKHTIVVKKYDVDNDGVEWTFVDNNIGISYSSIKEFHQYLRRHGFRALPKKKATTKSVRVQGVSIPVTEDNNDQARKLEIDRIWDITRRFCE